MKRREALSLLTGVAILTLATAAIGAPSAGGPGSNNPDVLEVRQYRLTIDKAEKTAAAMASINQMVAATPGMKAKMDASTAGNLPITQQAKNIDANFPQVAAIIHNNGLTTREWIVATGAIINDVGFVGMKKQGLIKEYPANAITPENAALIEQNWDKFQVIASKMSPGSSR
jgi:hypothetical protein